MSAKGMTRVSTKLLFLVGIVEQRRREIEVGYLATYDGDNRSSKKKRIKTRRKAKPKKAAPDHQRGRAYDICHLKALVLDMLISRLAGFQEGAAEVYLQTMTVSQSTLPYKEFDWLKRRKNKPVIEVLEEITASELKRKQREVRHANREDFCLPLLIEQQQLLHELQGWFAMLAEQD